MGRIAFHAGQASLGTGRVKEGFEFCQEALQCIRKCPASGVPMVEVEKGRMLVSIARHALEQNNLVLLDACLAEADRLPEEVQNVAGYTRAVRAKMRSHKV